MKRVYGWFVLLLWLPAAFAGTACTEQPLTPTAVAQASRTGVSLFQTLEQSGAQVVIIGRVGADLSAYGLHFSHAGLAVRDYRKGRWTVVHLLNRCGTDQSALYDEGLINFFLDDPISYDALIAVPTPAVQQALLVALRGSLAERLHESRYNMIAYPQSQDFQNSNQWLLEFIAAALSGGTISSRAAVHQQPLWQQLQPDVINVDLGSRIGAGLFKANITFTDHPFADRVKGEYQIVSVRALVRWLRDTAMLERLVWLMPQRPGQSYSGAALGNALGRL